MSAPVFRRSLHVVRTSVHKYVTVQLLTKVDGYGEAGTLVKVLASTMRNLLAHGNKAVYVVPGQEPPLPIRKPQAPVEPVVVVKEKPVKAAAPKASPPQPLSLTGLSQLLSSNLKPKAKRESNGGVAAAATPETNAEDKAPLS